MSSLSRVFPALRVSRRVVTALQPVALLLLVGGVAACAHHDKPEWASSQKTAAVAPAPAPPAAEQGFYAEVEHEGRIYVIGSEASLAAFKSTHELGLSRAFIRRGPGRKTVVIEAGKTPELELRLMAAFHVRHGIRLDD